MAKSLARQISDQKKALEILESKQNQANQEKRNAAIALRDRKISQARKACEDTLVKLGYKKSGGSEKPESYDDRKDRGFISKKFQQYILDHGTKKETEEENIDHLVELYICHLQSKLKGGAWSPVENPTILTNEQVRNTGKHYRYIKPAIQFLK
tara:strand:+ start:540 stop:1001 length:462 start_codon:yes stop_codon:yes gene_type:complete